MIDIDSWFRCVETKPKKKGKYMLVIGKKAGVGSWLDIDTIYCMWNGHVWILTDGYVPIQWKYIKQ